MTNERTLLFSLAEALHGDGGSIGAGAEAAADKNNFRPQIGIADPIVGLRFDG